MLIRCAAFLRFMVQSGMEQGLNESYAALDRILAQAA